MTRILILHKLGEDYRALLAPDFPDVDFPVIRIEPEMTTLSPDAKAALADSDAVISIGRWMSRELLAASPRLGWFQCAITGVDHLVGPLSGSAITLTNARGIHGPQMAELTLLHMMAAYRELPRLIGNQQKHVWDRFRPRVLVNRTVVILGVGAIAGHVARVCKAMGMRTIGVSATPREVDGFDRIDHRDRMLSTVGEADFLVVLVPLTAENRKLVGAELLHAMKPASVVINIARGGVIDEAALVEALRAGRIAWAGLDVFETSPLPPESQLWAMPNVFITPYVGGQSDRYEADIMSIIKPNLRAFLAGRKDEMINIVPV